MKITVVYDMDEDRHILMAEDGMMRPMPAGPRLFRAPPHPDIAFSHTDPAKAERDAGKLRAYLAGLTLRKPTKKELKEFIA